MMKFKLKNDDPKRGSSEEYFLSTVLTRDAGPYVLPFTKHEVQRAFNRRKRVFSVPLPEGARKPLNIDVKNLITILNQEKQ